MAEFDDLDPRGRALLDAYRDHAGPSAAVQARLRAAVLRDAEDMSERAGPSAQVRELRPRGRWVGPVVLAALAAAVVAALSLRRADLEVADRAGSAAPWELAPAAPGTAAARRPARSASAATQGAEAGPAAEAGAEAGPAEEGAGASAQTWPEEQGAKDSRGAPARTWPEGQGAKDSRGAPARTWPEGQGAKDSPATERTWPEEQGAKDSPAAADGLAEEMAQMRAAQRALAEDRPADALAALAGYAARFPDGLLREEHGALQAIALCAAGREREGRGEARVFLRAHGASMFAARVRVACGIEGGATEVAGGGHSRDDGPRGP